MTRTVILYGLIAGSISILPFFLMPHSPEDMNMMVGMVVGFSVMVLAFLLIFVAVRKYRNQQGGIISFGKAFLMGLYISLIASVMYASVWEVYYQTNVNGQKYVEVYGKRQIESMRKEGKPEAEILKAQTEANTMNENYKNLAYRFPMVMMEILPVGVLMSLIAAATLRRKPRMVL